MPSKTTNRKFVNFLGFEVFELIDLSIYQNQKIETYGKKSVPWNNLI